VEGEAEITTVLFDVGGTLLHVDYFFLRQELLQVGTRVTTRAIRRAEYAARAEIDRLALTPTQETDETRRRPYFAVLLDQLAVDTDTAAQVIERLNAAHAQDNLWRLMFPSTPQVLAELRARGLTLGVISNADGRVTSLLQAQGIEQFFAVVIDSHHVGVEKPDPRIFQLALEQVKVQPEQAVFIGDIYAIDVIGAERVGMRPLLLDTLGCYQGVRCEKIRHLRDLISIL
jgi:putative hydrolase of the HAD superfamily